MNIIDSRSIRHCTSCQACAAVCAHKAISIHLNDEGFYRPVVDDALCTNCGLCASVCYKFDDNIKKSTEESLNGKQFYSAWSTDDDIVRQTTSGGLADVLAHKLLDEGYKVVGVVYNDEMVRAEHRIANSQEGLIPFRGSKYIQSYTLDAFKQVVANSRKEKYAVFGTPCQIYALSKYAEKLKVMDNLFLVDLFCHGCPSLYSWTKYQENIKKEKGLTSFDVVKFRSKRRGWGVYCVEAESDGKTVYLSKKNKDYYFELFFSDLILNDSCYDCRFRSSLEYTDIRLGDFWGRKFIGNHRGVSAVCISTEKGREMFDVLSGIETSQCEHSFILPNQNWNNAYPLDNESRTVLLDSLRNDEIDLKDSIKVLRKRQGGKRNLIRIVKSLLAYLPVSLLDRIKRTYYKISGK